MVALMLLDMLRDLSLEDLIRVFNGTGGFDYEGFGDLAFAFGGDADDDTVVDGRVGEEVCFEFCGCNLHAFYFD